MNNKKGFTLIELLAVIVILAIIALITTPIVLNLINQSKEAANKRSVEAYAKAVEYGVAQYEYEHNGELPTALSQITVDYSNSDVSCDVAVNCESKGHIVLRHCKVGSYTNTYYKYKSTKGAKGAEVETGNDAKAPTGTATCTY